MDRDQAMRWVDGLRRRMASEDTQGVEHLFTEDARYRRSPCAKSDLGHDPIKAFWLADAGETFAVKTEPGRSRWSDPCAASEE
jgi:hypothetical protein